MGLFSEENKRGFSKSVVAWNTDKQRKTAEKDVCLPLFVSAMQVVSDYPVTVKHGKVTQME